MAHGWVYHNWAMENDGWLSFNGTARKGKGYIKQEEDDLMAQVKKVYGR